MGTKYVRLQQEDQGLEGKENEAMAMAGDSEDGFVQGEEAEEG